MNIKCVKEFGLTFNKPTGRSRILQSIEIFATQSALKVLSSCKILTLKILVIQADTEICNS